MATTAPPITVSDAARTLGVSERTIWRYLRSGRLHGETVGPAGAQRTLIPADEVAAIASARNGGEELVALRAEVAALGDEVAALRAERDQLRTALATTRADMARLSRPKAHRAGDVVLAGLASLSRRGRA